MCWARAIFVNNYYYGNVKLVVTNHLSLLLLGEEMTRIHYLPRNRPSLLRRNRRILPAPLVILALALIVLFIATAIANANANNSLPALRAPLFSCWHKQVLLASL